jgi:hypothetical protein
LHSASLGTMLPSASMTASSKNSGGGTDQRNGVNLDQ